MHVSVKVVRNNDGLEGHLQKAVDELKSEHPEARIVSVTTAPKIHIAKGGICPHYVNCAIFYEE